MRVSWTLDRRVLTPSLGFQHAGWDTESERAAAGRVDSNRRASAAREGRDNNIYCAGTTPWGGDDTGVLPPDKATEQCEDGVGKAAAKAVACIIKCHKGRQSGKYADDSAEDNCETGSSPSSCLSKYNTATGKLTCDPCLDKAGLFAFIETSVDGVNGSVYCASSPSGAFLD